MMETIPEYDTIAFALVTLKGTQANYPVHEKELLDIICALTCWRTDPPRSPITIYTDHYTLENFDAQKDLSRRQARWQEFLTHYDHWIIYIKGEDNTVVDALSHLPDSVDDVLPMPAASLLMVGTDPELLKSIILGYTADPFCDKLLRSADSMTGVSVRNGLLYVGDQLVIPRIRTLCEDLFQLTHDNLGHFGFDKSYTSL
jgi:hypothetical protein